MENSYIYTHNWPKEGARVTQFKRLQKVVLVIQQLDQLRWLTQIDQSDSIRLKTQLAALFILMAAFHPVNPLIQNLRKYR